MTARKMKVGEVKTIKKIEFENKAQHTRMSHLGFIPETEITCYAKTFGSTAFEIKGSTFGLRNEDAEKIILK